MNSSSPGLVAGHPRWRPGGPPGGRPWRRRTKLLLAVGAAVAAVIGVGAGWYISGHRGGTAADPARVYQVPVHRAPGFVLRDQSGRKLALSDFRGKAVALYFMDDRCKDICPLVAQEFINADRDLGAKASRVALIGINVNPGYLAGRWLRAFDAQHGLNRLANWHYFTGTLSALRRVWENYSIAVQVNPKSGDVTHTAVIDFIGPHGQMRAMAASTSTGIVLRNGTAHLPADQLGQWGHSIAAELRRLLSAQPGGRRS